MLDTLAEIQERHEAVKELEKSLMELHQIFLDMAVLVEAQGEMLDNIEQQVSHSYVHMSTRLQLFACRGERYSCSHESVIVSRHGFFYYSPRRDATQHCITLLETTLMVDLQGECWATLSSRLAQCHLTCRQLCIEHRGPHFSWCCMHVVVAIYIKAC